MSPQVPVASCEGTTFPDEKPLASRQALHDYASSREALAKWPVNVAASTTLGTPSVVGPRDNIQAINPMLSRECYQAR
jgi:hypothetical protein